MADVNLPQLERGNHGRDQTELTRARWEVPVHTGSPIRHADQSPNGHAAPSSNGHAGSSSNGHAAPPRPRRRVRYITKVADIPDIPDHERRLLEEVARTYVFRANDYYLRLIDWADPDDPIRQLIIPRAEELNDWGRLDASNEAGVTVAHGVQHKYTDTVLLLCNEVCGAYCRYCFRKRLFMNDNEEASNDITPGLDYIRQHTEVSNVLLTGGDPLILSTRRIKEILGAVRAIPHVRIIRIGTKMTAFNPFRILNDEKLQAAFRRYSTPRKRIYLMNHFDHPRELTDEAVAGIDMALRCGLVCVNQCPLIRGVNDDPNTLAELYATLSYIGCPPYYLFQGRPTRGNEPYEVPLVEGYEIFREALRRCGSGLAARPRFCMSHADGKIEILAVDDDYIYARFHRAKNPLNRGRFMLFHRDDDACWLDELTPARNAPIPKRTSA